MCLNPIRIINPKTKIRLNGGENYLISVPCGKCAECVYLKRKEARMRAYYEFRDTIENGGCVYFESLTYNNKNLPRLSDFIPRIKGDKLNISCFKRKDITDYIKRVREKLYRMGYKRSCIKYFVASEYGSDKKYKDDKGCIRRGTKRPHYHIIWYFKNNNYKDLIKTSDKCWGKGRTDILNAHKHLFKKGIYDDFEHIMSVCGYVAKYVTKDTKYYDKVGNSIEKLAKKYNLSDEEIDKLKKETEMYHKWSNGFGIAGLEYNEEKDLNEKMRIKIPHKDKIWDYAKLPNYYKRKLHYNCIKKNGKYKWVLKDEFINNYIEKEYKSSEMLYRRTKDIIENLHNYIKEGDIFDKKTLKGKDVQNKINDIQIEIKRLLDNRTIKDYAIYQTRYKGRLCEIMTDDMIERKYDVTNNDKCNVEEIATNFAHYTYKKKLPMQFVALGYDIENEITKMIENGISLSNEYILTRCDAHKVIDCKTYAKIATINENNVFDFRNFDKLESFLSYALSGHNKRCQKTAEEIEESQRRLKEAQGG